jgi:3-phenylpropionate/cinnamic acid dioxygenase small subunit
MSNSGMTMLKIEDRLELHELAGRYGDIIDDRNWEALDSIFTSDAVFEVVGLVVMNGLAEIQRFMREEGRHPLAHLITNVHVGTGPDGIRLYCRGIFPITSEQGEPGQRVFYGSYYDRVVKTDRGWRIANRLFSTQRLAAAGS